MDFSFLNVILTSLFSLAALFLLTKMMGNKQVSQMNMFDYIVGISIGSIAAEMASELEDPWRPFTAMVVYAVLAFIISIFTSKSNRIKKFITGRPLVLFDNGKLYRDNLKKARIDMSELLTQCRVAGYFDLSQMQTILVENNGQFAFLQKSGYRPTNPVDFSKQPDQEFLFTDVIMDGKILQENLKLIGKDEIWLGRELKRLGEKNIKTIALACCDNSNTLRVFVYSDKKRTEDPFE